MRKSTFKECLDVRDSVSLPLRRDCVAAAVIDRVFTWNDSVAVAQPANEGLRTIDASN
jgi:hypothetical protein